MCPVAGGNTWLSFYPILLLVAPHWTDLTLSLHTHTITLSLYCHRLIQHSTNQSSKEYQPTTPLLLHYSTTPLLHHSSTTVPIMHFCPICSNLLLIEDGLSGMRFCCPTCPYARDITKTYSSKVKLTRKEVDDVLGGADAWENVDRTETVCPFCAHTTAYFMQMQIRSVSLKMITMNDTEDWDGYWVFPLLYWNLLCNLIIPFSFL
jgi:DNA-directed RNA polymerase III subunit RPC11